MKFKLLLPVFVMGLAFNALSNDILAEKEGSFEKYDKCSLSKSIGTLEAGHSSRAKLIQTSKYYDDFYDLDGLVRPVLAGVGRNFRRWSPTQTYYRIKDTLNNLSVFYAVGFLNVPNQAIESVELISKIDHICDQQLNDFNILGEFNIDLKIGNKVFADKLVVKRTKDFWRLNIDGTYIVPNSFESKLEKLNYEDGKFSFTIHVLEGEDDYKAIFEGFLHASGELEGKAYVLPERNLLGTFTGNKI